MGGTGKHRAGRRKGNQPDALHHTSGIDGNDLAALRHLTLRQTLPQVIAHP